MQAEFRQLNQKGEYMAAWPLVQKQYPELTESEYWRLLAEMMYAGHLMAGLYLQERMIGVVGICKGANWSYGEHLWLHLMILDKAHQGQGYEDIMVDFIIEWAQAQSCRYIYTTIEINELIASSVARLEKRNLHFVSDSRLWQLDLKVDNRQQLLPDCTQ